MTITDGLPCAARKDLAVNSDLHILYHGLEAEPAELTRYGVTADKLDEQSDAILAHAYRWCMAQGKWPHKRERYAVRGTQYGFGTIAQGRAVPAAYRWAWYDPYRAKEKVAGIYPVVDWHPHSLSSLLIRAEQHVYRTHRLAMEALAGWLHGLKTTYSLEQGAAA